LGWENEDGILGNMRYGGRGEAEEDGKPCCQGGKKWEREVSCAVADDRVWGLGSGPGKEPGRKRIWVIDGRNRYPEGPIEESYLQRSRIGWIR
jgi:hypothetical protein